jgi:thiamine kinase-like enzyme
MTDAGARLRALPVWDGPIRWEPLHGGLSNESFTVTDARGKYVVRFGRDFPFHHVWREREAMVARAAHAAGFAPEVVHIGPGVMVVRFVEGRTYGAEDVRANLSRIAALIRRFHAEMPRHVSGPAFLFWPFHVIRDYARTLEVGLSRMTARLPEFLALADEMERAQVPMPIVFGHHDLLPANFIDDGGRLWLIDFEYAGFGTAMFDLAGIASNAGCDAREAEALIEAYLCARPDEAVIRSHAAMQVASLLREAMWSMVSEIYLNAPGADYVAYTLQNLIALDAALAAYRARFGKD